MSSFEFPGVRNIDVTKVVQALPDSAWRLRAFMHRFEFLEDNDPSRTAYVRLRKDGVKVYFNSVWAKEFITSYTDIAFVVFHELLHVICDHHNLDRWRLLFGDHFNGVQSLEEFNSKPRTAQEQEMAKMILYVLEMEIKHIEHLVMPEDEFHDVNRRLFADSEHDQYRIFWRGVDLDEIEEAHLRAFHKQIYSQHEYSTRKAFQILRAIQRSGGQDGESGGAGSDQLIPSRGGSSDSPPSDSKSEGRKTPGEGDGQPEEEGEEGGGEPPNQEEPEVEGDDQKDDPSGEGDSGDEGSSGDDDNETDGEGANDGDDEGDGHGGDDSGRDKDGSESDSEDGADSTEGSSGGKPEKGPPATIGSNSGVDDDVDTSSIKELMEAIQQGIEAGKSASENTGTEAPDPEAMNLIEGSVQDFIDATRSRLITREIKKARSISSNISIISAKIQKEMGSAITKTTRPDYKSDRRAAQDWAAGTWRPYYFKKRATDESKIAAYFDVSTSQEAHIPACCQLLLANRQYLADGHLYMFADYVVDVPLSEFVLAAERNAVVAPGGYYGNSRTSPTGTGSVMGRIPSSHRGTLFDPVIEHIRERGYKKVVVITDNVARAPVREGWLDMKRKGLYFLMVKTAEKDSYTSRTWPGFMDELVSESISLREPEPYTQ